MFSLKKGSSHALLPFFIAQIFLLCSCSKDLSNYGRVTLHNTADKNSFIFSVNEEFLQKNRANEPDKKNPKLSKGEAVLLLALLKEKKYCVSEKSSSPLFIVTSRQEKIYDMTFAHLIEQSYNARPIAPRMYFGECIK